MEPEKRKKHYTPTQKFLCYYASTVAIILLLAIANQIIIQFTLVQEVKTRNLAVSIGRQQKRAIVIESDAEAFLSHQTDIERTHTLTDLINNTDGLSQTQEACYHGNRSIGIPSNLPDDVRALVNKSIVDYNAIYSSSQQIIAIESQGTGSTSTSTIELLVHTIQKHRPSYQQDFFDAFNSFSAQADNLVQDVRLIEIAIFMFTPIILIYEYFFVVRPAAKSLTAEMVVRQMRQQQGKNQTA